jgi:2-polyprenyl-3-methyl-5-hydroxy-6-metoxy-1,4-benzoquinol methylase
VREDEEGPRASEDGETRLARFVGEEPTRDLDDWHWLWTADQPLPISTHREGPLARFVVLAKKLLRPLVRLPQQDLWDRQRLFNLIVLEQLRRIEDLRTDLSAVDARLRSLEACFDEGLREIARYNDALYSRVDLKLERTLESSRRLHRDLIAASRDVDRSARFGVPAAPSQAGVLSSLVQRAYVDFEDQHRGNESEIRERVAAYVPELRERAPVLDLGCGRGELLQLLREAGVEARGVDGNSAMVRRCREDHGLEVAQGDLLDALNSAPVGSLGAVVCLHVVEHLEADVVSRLLDGAMNALRPGGRLVIETPNPLSLAAGARNFWLDPTHLRPLHPQQLVAACIAAGFCDVGFETIHPFPQEQRLAPVGVGATEAQGESARAMFARLARLRDELDDLIYGDQDYVLRATRPADAT